VLLVLDDVFNKKENYRELPQCGQKTAEVKTEAPQFEQKLPSLGAVCFMALSNGESPKVGSALDSKVKF